MRLIPLLALALTAGCVSLPSGIPHAETLVPNETGRRQYLEGHGAWEDALADPRHAIESLLAARGALRQAQRTDRGLPLYFSQEGFVALELAKRYQARNQAESACYIALAETAFRASLQLCPDWAPGHSGLAELARRTGQPAVARRHELDANLAKEVLKGACASPIAFRQSTRHYHKLTLPGASECAARLSGQLLEADLWTPASSNALASLH